MRISVRDATPDDAGAIAEIYNHYVLNSTATFDIEQVSVESRRDLVTRRAPGFPMVVAERADRVAGWGSLSPWASRPAWHRTVEVSVYVRSGDRGAGIGSAIMGELIERARAAGHHVMISQIVDGNVESLAMAEKMGFVRVGVLREVGDKFDRWHDLVLAQLILD